METSEKRLGNLYGFTGGNYDGNVYDSEMLCPTMRSCMCHGSVPEIVVIERIDIVNGEIRISKSRAEQSRAEQPKDCVTVIGQMDNTQDHTFESANRVYSRNGISPTVNTCGGGGLEPKVVEIVRMDSKVIGGFGEKKSNGGTQYFQQDRVYSMGDVSLSLPAQLPGGSYNYLEVKEVNAEIKVLGNYMPSGFENSRVVDSSGIAPTVKENHGTVNAVVEERLLDAQSIRMVRTEEGKALRKAYESGEIHHGFNEHRTAEPRQDGVSNTIDTVQKDLQIFEEKKIKVRQATKDGFVEVLLGGGGRFGISDIADEKGKSARERNDKSYSDNGEYP